ncbi:sel1 repeat family protein [Vibrio sp. SCSIO 43140]|uniref:tetratricopeptide repeat protein n=1 Tax=Vibrio sp. SCSIO 43140 TaxID=2819100 RepID=UPI0020752BAA|nr:tetratricopeptide repeat protein [Vibrio sp. SCSIO 43140]USD59552.1 sel1 repeat family protein [Vibrio sp. SCSIO 43140]
MENANRISILSIFALLVVGMTFFDHARDDMPPIDSSLGVTFQNGYQGDSKAQYQIGMHYLNGVDSGSAYLEQNSEQARAWLSQSAHNGHADAQLQLGLLYASGTGGEQDASMAVSWIGKAADQNHPQALDLLHWVSQSAH